MFEKRYERNGTTITPEEQKILEKKRVFVAGCGGLGGYIIEMLVRAGVGTIGVADPDVFDETNLNRQLFCEESLIGTAKVHAVVERCGKINRDTVVIPHQLRIDGKSGKVHMKGYDLIFDALDNIAGRLDLEKTACDLDIPLVHGAINSWYGQVSLIMPGDNLFSVLYPDGVSTEVDGSGGNPSFSPAVTAGFQVAEGLKVLLSKGEPLRNKLLFIDMLTSKVDIMPLR